LTAIFILKNRNLNLEKKKIFINYEVFCIYIYHIGNWSRHKSPLNAEITNYFIPVFLLLLYEFFMDKLFYQVTSLIFNQNLLIPLNFKIHLKPIRCYYLLIYHHTNLLNWNLFLNSLEFIFLYFYEFLSIIQYYFNLSSNSSFLCIYILNKLYIYFLSYNANSKIII
jgi:hypothetical protein